MVMCCSHAFLVLWGEQITTIERLIQGHLLFFTKIACFVHSVPMASTSAAQAPAESIQKHRTVGVSMHPSLEQRAKLRADALGLKFSPYVTLCVEAELKGFSQIVRDESLDLDSAIQRARDYMEKKTLSIDFELDIERALTDAGIEFERFARVGDMRTDFLIPLSNRRHIAIECRYNIRAHYAVALGQTILLKAHSGIDRVILVVPYLTGFDETVLGQFRQQGITVTTPDELPSVLS